MSALPKCGAETRSGGLCRNPAGFKTGHVGYGRCHLHGGNTPTHIKAAQEQAARAAMATYGQPVETTGVEALLEELKWTAGHVRWLRDVVQALEPEALVWGVTKRKTAAAELVEEDRDYPRDPADVELAALPEVTEAAGVSVWVKLYLEERRHLLDVAERCVRVGIEERRIRLAEEQGRMLVLALRWLGDKLELNTAQAAAFNELVPRMLLALDAGEIPTLEGSRA